MIQRPNSARERTAKAECRFEATGMPSTPVLDNAGNRPQIAADFALLALSFSQRDPGVLVAPATYW